jgi:hypothetical protein
LIVVVVAVAVTRFNIYLISMEPSKDGLMINILAQLRLRLVGCSRPGQAGEMQGQVDWLPARHQSLARLQKAVLGLAFVSCFPGLLHASWAFTCAYIVSCMQVQLSNFCSVNQTLSQTNLAHICFQTNHAKPACTRPGSRWPGSAAQPGLSHPPTNQAHTHLAYV